MSIQNQWKVVAIGSGLLSLFAIYKAYGANTVSQVLTGGVTPFLKLR